MFGERSLDGSFCLLRSSSVGLSTALQSSPQNAVWCFMFASVRRFSRNVRERFCRSTTSAGTFTMSPFMLSIACSRLSWSDFISSGSLNAFSTSCSSFFAMILGNSFFRLSSSCSFAN